MKKAVLIFASILIFVSAVGAQKLNFVVRDVDFKQGSTVNIPFTSDNFTSMILFQVVFGYDKTVLQYKGSDPGQLGLVEDYFGVDETAGTIKISWDDFNSRTFTNSDVLYTFSFTALKDGNLKDVLDTVMLPNIPNEAYNSDDVKKEVVLTFLPKQVSTQDISIYAPSVYPNPMSQKSTVELRKPLEKGSYTLYDSSGRKMRTQQIQGSRFYIEREDLPAGIYNLKINESGKSIANIQVVIQ